MKPNIELIETLRKSKKMTLEEMGKALGYKANYKQNAMYAMTTMSKLSDIATLFGVEEFNLLSQEKK